jgi:hypothetical protein
MEASCPMISKSTTQFWQSKQYGISISADTQTKGTEGPETNHHIYSQLIFDKDAKSTQWGGIVSSVNSAEKSRYPYTEE